MYNCRSGEGQVRDGGKGEEKKKMLKRGKAFLISKETSDRTCYFSDYPNGSKSLFPLLVFIPFPKDLKI